MGKYDQIDYPVFLAPNFSIASKEKVGEKVITTVVIDDELMEFEATAEMIEAGCQLEDPDEFEANFAKG